jgi:hypothetical protein
MDDHRWKSRSTGVPIRCPQGATVGYRRSMSEMSSGEWAAGSAIGTANAPEADPSIGYLLERYLADHRSGAAGGVTYQATVTVIDLLRGYLNRFGYQELSVADRERFERAFFGDGDADAFCTLFGAAELRPRLDTFVRVHLPERVRADPSVIAQATRVIADLTRWLDARPPAPK